MSTVSPKDLASTHLSVRVIDRPGIAVAVAQTDEVAWRTRRTWNRTESLESCLSIRGEAGGLSEDNRDALRERAVSELVERLAVSCWPERTFQARPGDVDRFVELLTRIPGGPPMEEGVFGEEVSRVSHAEDWVIGLDLVEGTEIAVPASAVYLYGSSGLPSPFMSAASTIGCAAHVTDEAAIESALLECVERDVLVRAWCGDLEFMRLDRTEEAGCASFCDGSFGELRTSFGVAESSGGIATVVARVQSSCERLRNVVGSAASASVPQAARHALAEALTTFWALATPAARRPQTLRGAEELAIGEWAWAFDALFQGERQYISPVRREGPRLNGVLPVLGVVIAVPLTFEAGWAGGRRAWRVLTPSLAMPYYGKRVLCDLASQGQTMIGYRLPFPHPFT